MKQIDFVKADREAIAEMQELIELERRKPADQRDYDRIEQLTAVIYEATSIENLNEIAARKIEELTQISAKKNRSFVRTRWMRRAAILAACAMLCVGLNAWSLHVYGMSFPKAFYRITNGGVLFKISDLEPETIELQTSEDDPFGIRTECSKHGFSPLTPAYLPDGMILTILSVSDAKAGEHDGKKANVYFTYRDSKVPSETVSLNYSFIEDDFQLNNTEWGFPSDELKVHGEEIGGKNVVISWEDEVFHAAFSEKDRHIVYQISTNYIGYDESYRILCSYFE